MNGAETGLAASNEKQTESVRRSVMETVVISRTGAPHRMLSRTQILERAGPISRSGSVIVAAMSVLCRHRQR